MIDRFSRGSGYTILAPAAAIDFAKRGELIMLAMRHRVYLVRNPAKPVTRASRELERIRLEVIHDLVVRGIWQAEDPSAASQA